MYIDSAILEKVRTVMADVLCVEPEKVTADSMFGADLDGESIELLDLSFRLEREFGVRVRFTDLDLQVGPDGALTDESLTRIQSAWPLLDVSRWRGRRFTRPLDLLSVGDIAALVQCACQQPKARAG